MPRSRRRHVAAEDPTPGRYLLTGSQNFALLDSVSQSLAGRTAILQLLPLDLEKVRRFPQPTARRWLSVLEASYIVFRLSPFHVNFGKRLIETPKLYFYDSGLVASLLGIENSDQLATHPLRGSIFETWVVSEIVKQHRHRAKRPHLFFYQERGRLEIDLVMEKGADLTLVEVKAGRTPSSAYFSGFSPFEARLNERGDGRWRLSHRLVVYGGDSSQSRGAGELVSWRDLPRYGRRI